MAILKIITTENPILRQKAKKINRFDASLTQLADDMFETMHAAQGVGLAAPQIAKSIRLIVVEADEKRFALVNPEIIKASGEEEGREGCLSIPGYYATCIKRATQITVKARDLLGKEVRIKAENFLARVLQHEIDHLNGILFIDYLTNLKEQLMHTDEEKPIDDTQEADKRTQGTEELVAPQV